MFMVENPNLDDWKTLQYFVYRLFTEIGFTAQEEAVLQTPRGVVEVDVYAVDENSVDKIRYIVECKCWTATVHQGVVHAFTTVMQETGTNIGFIVSKAGLQTGAIRYTTNTNIVGITFNELQNRYFDSWWKNHFCHAIAEKEENVLSSTAPFNFRRDAALENLAEDKIKLFFNIERNYGAFSKFIWTRDFRTISPLFGKRSPGISQIEEYKEKLSDLLEGHITFRATCWRELLDEMCGWLDEVEQSLRKLFGCDTFQYLLQD